MKELGKIIVNGRGEEKSVFSPDFPTVIPEENILFTSDKKKIGIDWRRNFDRMKEMADSWKELYPYQDSTKVNANVLMEYPDLPYGVWTLSDAHIGNVDTQYDLLKKHVSLIENTPNTGIITLGDDIDFGILPKLEVRFMQTMGPMGQAFTASDLMDEFNGRNPRKKQLAIAHCIGNHTHTMMQTTGILYEKFYERSKAAILPGMGQVFLKVGDQEYEIGLAHKFRGRSILNINLEPKRLMEYWYPNADMAAVGDFHKAGHETFVKGMKKRLTVRPGTYRTGTGLFEKNRGYGGGDLGGAFTLFYPDRHEMLHFDKLEEGINYLENLITVKEYKTG